MRWFWEWLYGWLAGPLGCRMCQDRRCYHRERDHYNETGGYRCAYCQCPGFTEFMR